jgi:hypothetical protein
VPKVFRDGSISVQVVLVLDLLLSSWLSDIRVDYGYYFRTLICIGYQDGMLRLLLSVNQ